MVNLEVSWIKDFSTQKTALQETFHCSGQLLKKYFSNKELNRAIRAKDTIRLPLDLVNHLKINPVYVGPKALVLSETNDYLVVHKPSGIHSHPLCYSDQNTVLNFLAEQNQWEALRVNENNYDRGLIFRLDFETSGILIVAKTEDFFQKMRIGFKEKMKRKFYWAIVGEGFDKEGEWIHYFKASGAKGSKQKVDVHPHVDAAAGVLEVRKILCENNRTLVLVNLNSGLRHQIRAQLAILGFPILGDELYGGEKADRLYLHALRYEWDEIQEDPNAELFDRFFDLNRALKMSHDMLGVFKSR